MSVVEIFREIDISMNCLKSLKRLFKKLVYLTHYIRICLMFTKVLCPPVPVPGLLATDRRHTERMFKYFPSLVLVQGPAAGWALQTLQQEGSHCL